MLPTAPSAGAMRRDGAAGDGRRPQCHRHRAGYENGYSEEIVGRGLAGPARGHVRDRQDRPFRPAARLAGRRQPCEAGPPDGRRLRVSWMLRDGRLAGIAARRHDGATGRLCPAPAVCDSAAYPATIPMCWLRRSAAVPANIVLFPVGPFCDERYIGEVLPLARRHEVGTVCFKTFGAGKLVGDTAGYGRPLSPRPRGKLSSGGVNPADAPSPESSPNSPLLPTLSVSECVNYTSLCPDVALLGMSFPNEQDAAFRAAADFRPLSPRELADIRAGAPVRPLRAKARIGGIPTRRKQQTADPRPTGLADSNIRNRVLQKYSHRLGSQVLETTTAFPTDYPPGPLHFAICGSLIECSAVRCFFRQQQGSRPPTDFRPRFGVGP